MLKVGIVSAYEGWRYNDARPHKHIQQVGVPIFECGWEIDEWKATFTPIGSTSQGL